MTFEQNESALRRLEDHYLDPPEDDDIEVGEDDDPGDYHEELMLKIWESKREDK